MSNTCSCKCSETLENVKVISIWQMCRKPAIDKAVPKYPVSTACTRKKYDDNYNTVQFHSCQDCLSSLYQETLVPLVLPDAHHFSIFGTATYYPAPTRSGWRPPNTGQWPSIIHGPKINGALSGTVDIIGSNCAITLPWSHKLNTPINITYLKPT